MAILSPVKKLFIPNKNMPAFTKQAYGTDMRAIENYVNALQTGGGGITEITSTDGTVIITDPTGPITDLSAPGGGGGSVSIGEWVLTTGPDIRAISGSDPFGLPFSGMANPPAGVDLTSHWLTKSPPSGVSFSQWTFTTSWQYQVAGGWSVCFLPIIASPAFTGVSTIDFSFTIYAFAPDFLDAAIWQTDFISIGPSNFYQTLDTDFVNNIGPPFGDLSLQPFGTAFEGNGIVSAAGDVYMGAAQVNISVPHAAVFA